MRRSLGSGDLVSETRERAHRYIAGLREMLGRIRAEILSPESRRVVEMARNYLSDSEYYYDKGDYITALVTASYSEGLIDALKYRGEISEEWPRPEKRKVVVAGTFDLVHPGHIYLLREASKLGDLYVIVARDRNVRRFKGRNPVMGEECRLEVVSSIRYVRKALLGDEEDILKPIIELNPDYILLGPDQKFSPEELEGILRERGLDRVKVLKLGSKHRLDGCPASTSEIVETIRGSKGF